ncbi:hypothetical protein [Pseudomonas fluorescens]|uniref:hypothetical protein n=1 Tax=Pseudomonas fluorescens TaxID=294 RepID=UPI002005A6B1|nr:hypothetical protein [Pseudomonas fluorescens]MCK3829885.1 hypothetical protein [Pseudomonas fluorescens]
MKKIIGLTFGIACLAATLQVQANTSAQLVVRGTITPAACNLSLAGSGEERTTSLVINCGTTPARFGLTFTDLQAGSKVAGILGAGFSEAQNFGLGMAASRRTGGYSVTLRDLRSTGTTLFPIMRTGLGAWQNSDGRVAQSPSQYSWRNSVTVTPAAISQLTATVAVKAVINKAQDLDLSRDISIDGRATLVLSYI